MEVAIEDQSESSVNNFENSMLSEESPAVSAESVKKPSKPIKANRSMLVSASLGSVSSLRKSTDSLIAASVSSDRSKPVLTKSSSTLTKHTASSAASAMRRNSTGGLAERKGSTAATKLDTGASSDGRKAMPSLSDPGKHSTFENRRASTPSVSSRSTTPQVISEAERSYPVSSSSPSSNGNKTEVRRKPTIKPALPVFNTKKAPHSPVDSSNGLSSLKKTAPSVSSPSTQSLSVSGSLKSGILSSSVNRGSSLQTQKKASAKESRDFRLMMLPQVDTKAGDELRLDLRGHRIRSLSASGLNLSPNLEFVYLRDNLLSSVEGIEILKRVKVLDLSFNEFKGPGLEHLENCKVLQQLYLAGNQITSLASLPQLPNLEFLSVAQNKLKSLSMASQPCLQVLAASKNRITTLKGFPHLPNLEHLRVEENPILGIPHLEAASVLLVGPSLKKFNDRDLSSEELKISKLYPAHTALCIRDGWEFCHPELAAESTFRFLTEKWKDHMPPGYMLKEAFIDQPFEEDICRCRFSFSSPSNDSDLVLKYQWFIGERTPTNFVPITDAVSEVYWPKHGDVGKCLKAECIPILRETEYPSIFAVSVPVSQGTGCPKVTSLTIRGELIEGNAIMGFAEVAWCGGTPGKGVTSWLRRRWNSSPVVIVGAESAEYVLTVDDIDSSLVFMYTPVTEEGVQGEAQYAMTDYVKAAPPSVKNVQIFGHAVEGNTIKGVGEYFGGREGPSKFEWLRENRDSGNFVSVLTGTTEYTLTKEDIGSRMVFVYVPMNLEGHEGESKSIVTGVVKKAPPKLTNLKITGDMREGNKISVTAIVTGGSEGSSRVQWFKTAFLKVEDESSLEPLSTSKISKAFRIPLNAVGSYIVAKFTPMASDGETGEPGYVVSDKTVETLPPSLNFVTVTGEYSEGSMLTASYGYIGGHEGKSLYDWYLHQIETGAGALIPEASGHLQYRVTKDAIDKYVSFKCTPARNDGIFGEPRTVQSQERVIPGTPRLLSLQLLGKAVEGATLVAEKKYWGGEEGESVFRWFLTSPDGTQTEIERATSALYTLSFHDIGFLVSVACEPVRNDWVRGPIVVSEHIGPILPGPPVCKSLEFVGSLTEGNRLSFIAEYTGGERGECIHEWFRVKSNGSRDKISGDDFLHLSLEDVGKCIELVYTPVRKDGLRGTPTVILSSAITPAIPRGLQLIVPDCHEDKEVIPLKSYYGGIEGNGEYTWYRTKRKLEDLELAKISEAIEGVRAVGKNLIYTPSLEDVGSFLALHWLPTRADGKRGDPLGAISSNPVVAAFPVVSDVQLKVMSFGNYSGEGKYYGGYEGSSLYSWYRETNEETVLITGANSITYEVTDSDYNCHLLFGYTPVRSDSTVGELRLSEPSEIVLPELPRIEVLTFKGREIEGQVLTAVEVIPQSADQEHVWKNYIEEIKYQWFCSVSIGEEESFEPLPSQNSKSYRPCLEEVGRCLKCQCTVTDSFGRTSEPCSAVTSPVFPGLPKIDKLEIEGRGFHTNLYAVRGIYSGGIEGKSRVQWLRSMVGSPDLISIPGETGKMYEANVDDVGYRLVAIYTPVREDGIEGKPVSVSTDRIAVEPDIYKEVKQKLDLGSVKFEALCDKDRSAKKVPGVGSLEKRIVEVNRKRVKVVKPGSKASFPTTEVRGTYAPPFHIELYRNDQHRFKIVVDNENEVDLMVQTRHMRDVIVLVIRGFAQKFNSTSLNSLLKIET